MPYGPAPGFCFPLTEISVYILFICCLYDSFHHQNRHLAFLIGGLLFGLLLEFVDVYFLKGYTYGRFLVMLGAPPLDIPFWIGVGWGIIMYSSRLFTDRFGLPVLAAAAMDALLALNIDATMDVAAYRLHMWDWGWTAIHMDPLHSQWFGIPYNNYFGWLVVVFTYSYFSRLFSKSASGKINKKIFVKILIPLAAIFISEIILFSLFNNINPWLDQKFGIRSLHLLAGLLVFLVIIVIRGFRNRHPQKNEKATPVTWVVPAWFHLYFFIWFIAAGFYHENKWMFLFAFLNMSVGGFLHFGIYAGKRKLVSK